MKARNLLFALATLTAICLTGCKPEVIDDVIGGSTFYQFFARECKYARIFNCQREKRVVYKDITQDSYGEISDDTPVSVSKYLLRLETESYNWADLPTEEEIAGYTSEERKEFENKYKYSRPSENPDPVIEAKLSRIYNKTRAVLVTTEYTVTPIRDMRITSRQDFLQYKAGQRLNHLFLIEKQLSSPNSPSFVVTANKNIITDKKKISNITIDQYLSYGPMAPKGLLLAFKKEVRLTEPATVQFVVELETTEGNVIQAIAEPVTLIP